MDAYICQNIKLYTLSMCNLLGINYSSKKAVKNINHSHHFYT